VKDLKLQDVNIPSENKIPVIVLNGVSGHELKNIKMATDRKESIKIQ